MTAAGARTPEEVAKSYFAAVAARDADAMAAHWRPDGVDELTSIGILRGPDEVREFFGELFAALPDNETLVERITADDRVAVVQWRSSGTHTGAPLTGIDPTHRLVELRACDCIEVDDGLIVRNTAYVDGLLLARCLGLMPPQDSMAEKALVGAYNAANRLRETLRERFA